MKVDEVLKSMEFLVSCFEGTRIDGFLWNKDEVVKMVAARACRSLKLMKQLES